MDKPASGICSDCGLPVSGGAGGMLCGRCSLRLALSPEALTRPPSEAAVPDGLKSRFLGGYEILGEIARGGMGVVFRARQLGLNRVVALKMMQSHQLLSEEARLRFRIEIEAVAQLHHPHIVALYESGDQDGIHFFTMRLVEGVDLGAFLQRQPPLRLLILLLVKICRAVHYAHQRGILHRDLKPSNILVDEQAEPQVADFGLAKSLDQESGFTFTASVLGSPNYMAPEQASGKARSITTAVDVYGLGAILYHFLAGRPPFQAETLLETLRAVTDRDPVPPSTLKSGVDVDLETICLKCLRKVPTERYGSAEALAQDLERWLANEPILARPLGPAARAWRWCRRRPALAGAFALAVVALSLSIVLGVHVRQTERARVEEARQSALDRALMTAWSGDPEGTEHWIQAAERAGVSVGEVRMLRGTVAMHRGDYRHAQQELDQAASLLPESVAVRSMLMKAYLELGRSEATLKMLQTRKEVAPRTAEDFLFKGALESYWDPVEALKSLDEAVRRRPTGVARLVRGQVRTDHASNTGNLTDAESALEDAEAAKAMFPENPAALALNVKASLVAATLFQQAGAAEKQQAAWEKASRNAVALERFPDNPEAVLSRAMFLKMAVVTNGWSGLQKFCAARSSDNPALLWWQSLALHRLGRFKEGVELLSGQSGGSESLPNWQLGYLLVELPNGPQRVSELAERQMQAKPSATSKLAIQTTLRLAGHKDAAVRICRQIQSEDAPLMPRRNRWHQHLLDYNCGALAAEELLNQAGVSRWDRCEAHFFIGLTALSEGDRKEARHHFRQALATGVFFFPDYDWSGALLARLEQDPVWPPWIPSKSEP